MLRDSSTHTLSPHLEAPRLQILSHQLDDIRFSEPCALLNFIEGRSIFPRHTDDFALSCFSHKYIIIDKGNFAPCFALNYLQIPSARSPSPYDTIS